MNPGSASASCALLVLGSNLGDRLGHLRGAVTGLAKAGEIGAVSPVYESPAAGYVHQGPFLNLAVKLTTSLGPLRLLMWCKSLEFAAGRRPGIRFGSRPLDVDIAGLGRCIVRSDRVSIPHPHIAKRAFMVAPLADIAGAETLPEHDVPLAELDRQLGRAGVVPVAQPAAVWSSA